MLVTTVGTYGPTVEVAGGRWVEERSVDFCFSSLRIPRLKARHWSITETAYGSAIVVEPGIRSFVG